MKKIFMILGILSLILPLFSCYRMPYEPGVTIEGEETFYTNKKLWEKSKIEKYSFTYSYKCTYVPQTNYVVDVTVDGEDVSYEVKEYMNVSEENSTSETWEEYKIKCKDFITRNKFDNFSLNDIYSDIKQNIEAEYESLKKHPDCYYANFSFTFSEEAPFILSYEGCYSLMIKDACGNGAELKFQISNFEAK